MGAVPRVSPGGQRRVALEVDSGVLISVAGKEPPGQSKGQVSGAHSGPGTVLIVSSRAENLLTQRAPRGVIYRVLSVLGRK